MKTYVRVRPARNQRVLQTRDVFAIRVYQGSDCLREQQAAGLPLALKVAVRLAKEFGPGAIIRRPVARIPLDVDELRG